MKRRSKAGGEQLKGRRRKTPEPERGTAPKGQARPKLSLANEETEVARLTRELTDERRQRVATSEVLRLLSGSHGNLNNLFDTILASATNLCQANFGTLSLCEGDAFRIVATHNVPAGLAELRRREPLVRAGPLLRMAETKRLLHIADYMEYVASHPADSDAAAFAKLTGVRTILEVPMLKDDDLVGAIVIYRAEVRRFDDREIALLNDFAAQAVIAIENARLLTETRDALEQQTAMADVLRLISRSTFNLQPVLDTLIETAARLCNADAGSVWRKDGDVLRAIGVYGFSDDNTRLIKEARVTPSRATVAAQTVLEGRPVHIADVRQNPEYNRISRADLRAMLGVPLMRQGIVIGAFSLHRMEPRPFTDKQIELVTTFAAQAVIAIENARLLNELRQRTDDLSQRTADLTEALEQQTATSEVLQVISSSPGDLEPVFQAMLENATRICEAKFGVVLSFDGNEFHVEAHVGTPPKFAEYINRTRPLPQPLPGSLLDRLKQTKQVSHTADYAAEGIPAPPVTLGGARSTVDVPMLKDNELVGAFSIYRQEVRPFTEKQIDLVKNFAAQAVIAIENARLLNELRQRTTDLTEALEQQTATSDVLEVVSSSPGDLQPVFETMLTNATRICEAKFGVLWLSEGERFRCVALHNAPPTFADHYRDKPLVNPPPGSGLRRLFETRQVTQVTDMTTIRPYIERDPFVVASVELGGYRSVLNVPMLKEGALVGAISIFRQEVRPFTDRQVALVTNFAAQAVIAIENARLLNELRQRTTDLTERTVDLTEALEQQTATSEVLQAISSSPGEVERVFTAVLEKAVRICDAAFGNIFRWDGSTLQLVAGHKTPLAFAEARRRLPLDTTPNGPMGRMISTKTAVHIADLACEQVYIERSIPALAAAVELGGVRTLLVVPLLKEREPIGAFALSRQEVRPFTDKQIELVQNFAAQAVIAIENTRLLNELRERTEEVEKLNQDLEHRVADQVGEIERMSRLRRFLPPQVADLIVASGSEKQLESHRREITALFCDLRGFTGFTESADAEDVMALLRDYHAAIGGIITKYNGTLERYAGDGVMVVFNDPVPVENPPLRAVLMALEVREAIGALTETWRRLGHEIGFGIGIAHGFATLGTIGFEGRFDYAAIGTVSNVASRLCDEAKPGQILISPRVLMKVEKAVQVEPVGEFELKGIRRPLAAYNVVAAPSPKV